MNKILFAAAAAAVMSIGASAQNTTLKVNLKNGTTVEYPMNTVEDVTFDSEEGSQGGSAPVDANKVNVKVFKLLPKMVVLDWGTYVKGTGTNGQSAESRDFEFELAYTKRGAAIRRNTPGKTTWFQNGIFWPDNRFVYGGLKPETEYWFRIIQKKVGVNYDQTTDTTYVQFTTPAEQALPAGTVLYNDFDHFNIKGSIIYRAFGYAISNANVATNFDPTSDEDFMKKSNGMCTPQTTVDPMFDVRNDASKDLHYSKCPKLWEYYWETDKYGYENIADLDKYPGWSSYFARESTGAVLIGGASTAGAWLGTPRLTALGDTPTDITFITNTCAYFEMYHSWVEDQQCHYIIVDGPGEIVDGGATMIANDNPNRPQNADDNTSKQILVKMNPNKAGASMGALYDWNKTTK
ncbi:MAG: hypothetical protein K2M76_01535, partial [Muribaculaceae bacterium]|nr:hypothetical protein [Muribaculaceae bacterium]